MPVTTSRLFEWKEVYSVGIADIDAQHKELFRIAGELNDAMASGRGAGVLSGILERLISYTKKHFAYEERLMQIHKYPGFPTQKTQHEALTRQVLDFQRNFQEGTLLLTVDLMQFLHNWLENHILKSDKQYVPYLGKPAKAL